MRNSSRKRADAGEVRTFPQGPDAVNALKAGTVDAVVIDIPVAENAVEDGDGIEIVGGDPDRRRVWLRRSPRAKTELLEELNDGARRVKDDGTFATIYKKWFKREPPQELLLATHDAS